MSGDRGMKIEAWVEVFEEFPQVDDVKSDSSAGRSYVFGVENSEDWCLTMSYGRP